MATTKFTPGTAAAVIIASMVGTGVFTSLGFQLQNIQSGFVLLMLWAVGGVTALCGALSYAELGTALPRSGGEYNFLGRIYHPGAGFVSGWISATIGFSAPVALVALTFGEYLSSVYPILRADILAYILVIVVTFFHIHSHKSSGNFQRLFTLVKLILIVGFCLLCTFFTTEPTTVKFLPAKGDMNLILSGAFAVSLIYVNYAYTGWNTVTYISGEIENPQRYIPRNLIISTLTVMLLYIALNFTFLYVAPIEMMVGNVDIGFIAAQHVFGNIGGDIIGVVLALLLISTASAMIIAGPRVLQMIGEDYELFKFFSRTNQDGIPANAILFQSGLTLVFLLTSSFQSILIFAGFTLGLNSVLTIIGIFVLRFREPELHRPYKVWMYPLPPLIFLVLMLWTLIYTTYHKPKEAFWSLLVIILGVALYIAMVLFNKNKHQQP